MIEEKSRSPKASRRQRQAISEAPYYCTATRSKRRPSRWSPNHAGRVLWLNCDERSPNQANHGSWLYDPIPSRSSFSLKKMRPERGFLVPPPRRLRRDDSEASLLSQLPAPNRNQVQSYNQSLAEMARLVGPEGTNPARTHLTRKISAQAKFLNLDTIYKKIHHWMTPSVSLKTTLFFQENFITTKKIN